MKTYDCFMYLDEDVVLDLRLNYLNNYVEENLLDIHFLKKFRDLLLYPSKVKPMKYLRSQVKKK